MHMIENLPLQERLEHYLARSEQYRSLGYDNPATTAFVVALAGPPAGPALDIGTGKGSLTLELARQGIDVATIDLDPEEQQLAVYLAREEGLEHSIEFVVGDGARLPWPDAHFGWVGMLDVLHHLEEADPVLDEMLRVVRPGGTIMVSDFSEPGFEVIARVHREEGGEHPRTAATVDSAQIRLIGAGCELVTRVEEYLHQVSVLKRPL
ncbi:class I SAM-dependent methyltransferase [Gemmatimonadota bacterium]